VRKVLVVLVLLAAACGSASADRAKVKAPVSTTTTTEPLPARPTDAEGLRCQALVDSLVDEWSSTERATVPVICADKATHPEVRYVGGLNLGDYVFVAYGYPYPVADESYRSIAAHELGHAWETHNLDVEGRSRYMGLRGIVGTFLADADEDYADVFAIAFGEGAFTPNLVAPVPPGLIEQLKAEGLLPA
jgi:hypothetical protein